MTERSAVLEEFKKIDKEMATQDADEIERFEKINSQQDIKHTYISK